MKNSKIAAIAPTAVLVLWSCFFAPTAAVGGQVAVYLANRAAKTHESTVRDLTEALAISLMEEKGLAVVGHEQTAEAVESLEVHPTMLCSSLLKM